MNNTFKLYTACILFLGTVLSSCKKTEYNFGEINAPKNLVLNTTVLGADASNPNGDGSGEVEIKVTAEHALSYRIDFGDGNVEMVQSGEIVHSYATPGVNEFTITVNAIGAGGVTSTISKSVSVFVAFVIPADILTNLTQGSSVVWITDHDAPGHFGVGPIDAFGPIWYSAPPNTREACAYDDEITFSKDASDKVYMSVDNKGSSMSIGAATAFYGFSGPDGCYAIDASGNKLLEFSSANTGSTSSNSTQVQFKVPGNGIVNFGTGGVTYEILEISETGMTLRNIGADGNSWYQKLKVKP